MRTIILPGGSGFLGRALTTYFANNGDKVIILTRSEQASNHPHIQYLTWDGQHLGTWYKTLEGADAVINLAGKSVNCRYTPRNRQLIYDSRIDSTHVLGEAIKACHHPPAVWMNASTATIYRHAEDRPMTEAAGEYGAGMSVNVARDWEKTFFEAHTPEVRKVALRTSIVMDTQDGAFTRLLNLVRSGLGGKQGNGRQMISWIHLEDVIRAIEFLLHKPDLQGAFNITAPDPVPNSQFMTTLRTVAGVPVGLPAPRWLLEIGAALIQTETELILKSRWVLPERLLAAGFEFHFPTTKEAIFDLVNREDPLTCE